MQPYSQKAAPQASKMLGFLEQLTCEGTAYKLLFLHQIKP